MHKGPYHKRMLPVENHQIITHPLYVAWSNMFARCENKANPSYRNYGRRGITVCNRWRVFEYFLEDLGPRPSPRHTIDRKDNDKGYNKSNCRWATRNQQMLNRRKFKNGKTKSRGVHKKCDAYIARMDYEKQRYIIGYFDTEKQASDARNKFETLFLKDRAAAIATLPDDKARRNSVTGHRGINPHIDGGFIARATVNGERIYVGYFQTLEEAVNERNRIIKKANS